MKLIFYLQINTKIFYKLIISLWVCMTRHTQSIQNNNFIISLQYLKERVKDGVHFSLLIIVKRFFKAMLSFFLCVWPDMPKLPKTKSLLFLCNILKKKWMTKLTFCMHENLLQIDTVILMEMVKHFQSSQNSKCTMSVQVRDEVDFLHADKHQSGLQVDFNTLATKFGYKMILLLLISMLKHSQITQSNNFANLCNISTGVYFLHADKHQSF